MTSVVNSYIQWHAVKDSDKLQYIINSEELASKIVLPVDALMCKNPHCTDHHEDINCFYELLKLSTSHTIPNSDTSTKYNIGPGWNKYVKEHHSLAKDAQWW